MVCLEILGKGDCTLQYADDTILFSKVEDSALENLKCCLMLYEQLSGMRVNFHKSELVPVNLEEEETLRFAKKNSCPIGSFPLKYRILTLCLEMILNL
jgi:hypothetical protein